MTVDVTPVKTPTCCRSTANYSATTPRRRSGRRRTQSDTYRKFALTRSASQVLRIHKPMLASRSYSLRHKPLLLVLLSDKASKDSMLDNSGENSIQKITPSMDNAPSSSQAPGIEKPLAGQRKVKATSIKLNLFKSSNI